MKIFFTVFLFLSASYAGVEGYQLSSYVGPQEELWDRTMNDQMFATYCGVDVVRDSAEIPKPNYETPLVQEAAKKLNLVSPSSFYLYFRPVSIYGFRKSYDKVNDPDKTNKDFKYTFKSTYNPAPEGVRGNTHAFLTYLCGEFRDRPSMIEEKLQWSANINKMPARPQPPIDLAKVSPEKSVWHQLTAESYNYYIKFSHLAFADKSSHTKPKNSDFPGVTGALQIGQYTVDAPVPAFTICETEYILAEYIDSKQAYPGWETYSAGRGMRNLNKPIAEKTESRLQPSSTGISIFAVTLTSSPTPLSRTV